MFQWRYTDIVSVGLSLEVMRLMSSFSRPSADGRCPRPVDTLPMLEIMRDLTAFVDWQSLKPDSRMREKGAWTCGQLHLHKLVEAHVRSYEEAAPPDEVGHERDGTQPAHSRPWMSSWLGIASTGNLYYYSVVRLQHAEQPALHRIILRNLAILDWDVRTTEPTAWGVEDLDCSIRDFWLWKAFIGAFTLTKIVHEGVVNAEDPAVRALRLSFYRHIRRWREGLGVNCWDDVRATLKRVVWPTAYLRPGAAEATWAEVMTG
jgi:hypothetical protein